MRLSLSGIDGAVRLGSMRIVFRQSRAGLRKRYLSEKSVPLNRTSSEKKNQKLTGREVFVPGKTLSISGALQFV
jgi:hypothetical protein